MPRPIWIAVALACCSAPPTFDAGIDLRCNGPQDRDAGLVVREFGPITRRAAQGWIWLRQVNGGTWGSADYYRVAPLTPYDCEVSSSAECSFRHCSAGDAGDTATSDIGGPVTVDHLLVDGGTITLDDYSLGTFEFDAGLWLGGETVTATSRGIGDPFFHHVPAFQQTVVAPSFVSFVPNCVGASNFVQRDHPLTLSWSGRSAGVVLVELPSGHGKLSCRFPANQGSGTIPADLMSLVDAGPVTISVWTENQTRFDAGDFDISLWMQWHIRTFGTAFR